MREEFDQEYNIEKKNLAESGRIWQNLAESGNKSAAR